MCRESKRRHLHSGQCSVSSVESVKRDMDKCNGDYKVETCRKRPSVRSDCTHPPGIIPTSLGRFLGSIQTATWVCWWLLSVSNYRGFLLEGHEGHASRCWLLVIPSKLGQNGVTENMYIFTSFNFGRPRSSGRNRYMSEAVKKTAKNLCQQHRNKNAGYNLEGSRRSCYGYCKEFMCYANWSNIK